MYGNNHVSASAADHRVERVFTLLNIVDSLLLGYFPACASAYVEAPHVPNAFVRAVPIRLVDAVYSKVHLLTPFQKSFVLVASAAVAKTVM